MPINDRYSAGDRLFERASSEAIIRSKNKNPGVDADTENVGGGICSGITSAWITTLLNANKMPESRDTAKFAGLFDTLRFQGAYFKELHGTSDDHLAKLSSALIVNGANAGTIEARPLLAGQLPTQGWWAAYVSMRGHAIGIGKYEGFFHIMEPNFGLFTYNSEANFLSDLNGEVNSYMGKKNNAGQAKFIFYRRSTGGKV